MSDENIIRALSGWRVGCHEAVTREGELEPCAKPAVAIRKVEPELGDGYAEPYPVCAHHTRVGQCVGLGEIVYALRGRSDFKQGITRSLTREQWRQRLESECQGVTTVCAWPGCRYYATYEHERGGPHTGDCPLAEEELDFVSGSR